MDSKLIAGKAARPLAATTAAALLAGIVISGGGASSAAAATTPGTATTTASTTLATSPAAATTTAAATPTAPSAYGTCPPGSGPWPGWDGLYQIGQQLQQEAIDEEIYGTASSQASSDQMAIAMDEQGFSQIEMPQLPDSWAQEIQDQVFSAGPSPEQVQTAATTALSLADQLSLLCYTPSAVSPQAPGVLTWPSA